MKKDNSKVIKIIAIIVIVLGGVALAFGIAMCGVKDDESSSPPPQLEYSKYTGHTKVADIYPDMEKEFTASGMAFLNYTRVPLVLEVSGFHFSLYIDNKEFANELEKTLNENRDKYFEAMKNQSSSDIQEIISYLNDEEIESFKDELIKDRVEEFRSGEEKDIWVEGVYSYSRYESKVTLTDSEGSKYADYFIVNSGKELTFHLQKETSGEVLILLNAEEDAKEEAEEVSEQQ